MTKDKSIIEQKQKEARIKKELGRLKKVYKNIQKETYTVVEGLIYRAAFMRIILEDLELDIIINGNFELFTQSDKVDGYERERPSARLYNATNKNYQSIIKQLTGLLPKEEAKEVNDGFDDFISGRDD